MVLFPIALLWLVVVLVWIIRNSKNTPEPPEPPEQGPPKRFRPSPRHDPAFSGSRARARTASSAARRRD